MILLILAVCVFSRVVVAESQAGSKDDDLGRVLESAERFFKSLRAARYAEVWSLLSLRSQEIITEDIMNGPMTAGTRYTKDQIRADLRIGGLIATSYWRGVLQSFDPDLVLEESRWESGFMGRDKAELLITHRRSTNPAHLKLYKEADVWKVGMVESFWTRK
jgi:hypothetical protein